MDTINLNEAGLSENESKVYGALVQFGEMTSTEVSAKSGAPYGRIYDVLGKLMNKGLVRIIPGRTKHFVASSPEDLIKIIEKRQEALNNVKEKAKELKQFYDNKESKVIEIAQGDKGFWKIVNEMKEVKKEALSIKWDSKIKPENIIKRKKAIKRGIIHKDLVRYDEETKKNVRKWMSTSKDIRKIENDGVAMSIQDEDEVMIGLIKSNTTLLIRDRNFAKIMKKMFLETYKNSEKIK